MMLSPFSQTRSVWEETAVAAPETKPLTANAQCDVAIVGGGYAGLNAALELTRNGLSVIVLESSAIGAGASGRNGGQVVPGLKHDPEALMRMGPQGARLLDFAGDCADGLFDFIRTNGLRCEAHQSGWLQPAVTQAQLALVLDRARQWQRVKGIAVKLLDRRSVQEATGTDAYLGGWIDPRGGSLQPLSYVRELARIAIAAGVRLHTQSSVTALSESADGWTLDVGPLRVDAGKVYVATNGYTDGLVGNLARTIFPAHSVQVATEPLSQDALSRILPARMPVSDARRMLKYYRLNPQGRLIMGGRGSFGPEDTGHHYDVLKQVARSMFPDLRNVAWTHHWGGKIALTLDHLPHVHNPRRGLYATLGCNGRGVALASRMGIVAAQLIQGMDARESPVPVTQIRAVPFHAFRRPAMEVAAIWYRALDRLGF